MKALILCSVHYDVIVKGVEEPIRLSEEGAKKLILLLQSATCPAFLPINGNLYNRFEIARVERYEEKKTPERLKAEALLERITNHKSHEDSDIADGHMA